MNARKRWLRPLGVLLLLPLAGAIAGSVAFTATCDYDCGDMGGRGLFLLVLLATPPAAAGVGKPTSGGSLSPPSSRR